VSASKEEPASAIHPGGGFLGFCLTGFLLAASTLGSMLPYFNYPAQIFFFHIHRWSALVSMLSAILGLEAMIVE